MRDGVRAAAAAFDARVEAERSKALAKYGQLALLPGGHPSRDVLDHAINELVGLVRYGAMIEARVHELVVREGIDRRHLEFDWAAQQAQAIRIAMVLLGRHWGEALIELRQALLDAGLDLGAPEAAQADPWAGWLPTSAAINALPDPVRLYIADLEMRADPAGDVRELAICRDSLAAMERRAQAAEAELFGEEVRP